MTSERSLEVALEGFVEVSNSGPHGFAIGGYSRESANHVREFSPNDVVVTNIKRARQIAREIHGWDVAQENELVGRAMQGKLA